MDILTAYLETYPWATHLLATLAGVVLASAGLWSFLQYRSAKRAHALNAAKVIAELQKELLDKLILLSERSEEYANVRDGMLKGPIPGNELLKLQAQIDLLRAEIPAAELRLAKLEGREPRSINVQWIRPSSPTGRGS